MLWWLAQNTLIAAILALAVSVACRWFRFSPAVRHALWLVVLFKLITPPLACYPLPPIEPPPIASLPRIFLEPSRDPTGDDQADEVAFDSRNSTDGSDGTATDSGFSADDRLLEDVSTDELAAAKGEPADHRPIDRMRDGTESGAETGAETQTESLPQVGSQPWSHSPAPSASRAAATGKRAVWRRAAPGAAPSEQRPDATNVVPAAHVTQDTSENTAEITTMLPRVGLLARRVALAGWLLGSAVMLGVQWVRLVRCRRLLGRSRPAPGWLTAIVERSAGMVGVAVPQSRVTHECRTPLVCALGRTRLLWPASLSDRLDDDSRRAVVVHELAHLRRRDHWVGWLEFLASCLWWWNPLFWYVRGQLKENAELACDAWVVALLPQGRRAYAQALIEVSQLVSWTAAPVPAVGMGSIARHTFERRLTMILRDRVSSRAPLVGLVLIGLLALGVLPGWTQPPAVEPAAEKPSTKLPVSEGAAAPRASTPAAEAPAQAISESRSRVDDGRDGIPAAEAPAQGKSPSPTTPALVDRPVDAQQPADDRPDTEPARNREDQLMQLEARLAQLLEEVRALRTPTAPARHRLATTYDALVRPADVPVVSAEHGQRVELPHSNLPQSAGVQTLTRARYNLSEEAAEAVAVFIQQWVKGDIDVKVVHEAVEQSTLNNPGAELQKMMEKLDDYRRNSPEYRELEREIANCQAKLGEEPAILIVTASSADQVRRIGAFIELLSPTAAGSAGVGSGGDTPSKTSGPSRR